MQSDVRLGDVVISQPHMQHSGVVQWSDIQRVWVQVHFSHDKSLARGKGVDTQKCTLDSRERLGEYVPESPP